MPRFFRKTVGLLLATGLLLAMVPLAAASPEKAPLTIETSGKTLLSTFTYTVTVTNTSGTTIYNVSAEALFGRDLTPLARGGAVTAGRASLAPGESITLRCKARLNALKGLDVLLYPLHLLGNLIAGPAAETGPNGFDDGRAYAEKSAGARLLSFFSARYDAGVTARAWYGYPQTDDFSDMLANDFFEGYEDKRGEIAIEEDGAYFLLLSRARFLTAGIQADGDSLAVAQVRHHVAQTFSLEDAGEYFAIRSLATGLTVAAGDAAEGAALTLEAFTGADNQLWAKRADKDGQYQMINVSSGKAMDIGGGNALVQRAPGAGASQAWELNPIDAHGLAEPFVPDLSGPDNWARNAIRYPEEGRLTPAGPIYIQWYQDASLGQVAYYEIAVDGEMPVRVLPSGARIMGYRWYSTKPAHRGVRITAVLAGGARVVTATRNFTVTKKGIAWGTVYRLEDMNAAWYYNWYTMPAAGAASWLIFEPQVWGNTADLGLGGLRGKGLRSVMTFNEPDSATQADMTAAQALGRWPELMASGLRLGSPAMSNNAAAATGWLAPFMRTIENDPALEVDYMVMHCYASAAGAAGALAVLKMVDDNWARYRRPIWIKEFAVASFAPGSPWAPGGTGKAADVAAFMECLLEGLDKRPYVERYAWYPFATDDPDGAKSALFDYGTGELTALGRVYKGLGMP